jgi:alpha-N-arabinofuranosidase
VLAGLTLDTFNRHSDKVGMAAVAQLVNCLQSLFFAHEDKFCVTPTYHVFDMYRAHQGAQALRTLVSAPAIAYARDKGTGSLPGLSCSASLRDRTLTLTVTNPSLDQAREVDIELRGARGPSANGAKAVTLAAADAHAHNSFENPHAVEPREEQAQAGGARFTRRFPPASVTKLEIALA